MAVPISPRLSIHHIVAPKNGVRAFLVCFSALLLVPFSFYLFLLQGYSILIVLWSFVIEALLLKLMLWNAVKKESVLVMPAFGVQLETHYVSGKVNRRFIPVDKILKPVLLECVTPVTCYWSLCLVLYGEAELTSVFERLRQPVKKLVPIWKALCEATNKEESSNTSTENGL
ncbi:hypothetical protein TIFTF001_002141 [Ficus carica]|uniref:Phosphatidylinositol N-acetylglucosaminyltransferase subunit H conserved domain-containing protein n=1 Tax=Ficus carica TaxID=3494 RepID=A0AA87Z9D8_FICCA|nr:hypothetical protein TIFTF001_002141 [Ficus carica]